MFGSIEMSTLIFFPYASGNVLIQAGRIVIASDYNSCLFCRLQKQHLLSILYIFRDGFSFFDYNGYFIGKLTVFILGVKFITMINFNTTSLIVYDTYIWLQGLQTQVQKCRVQSIKRSTEILSWQHFTYI